MSDLDRLMRGFEDGTYVHPVRAPLNLVDLGIAIASICGAAVRPTAGARKIMELIGQPDRVLMMLIDGCGYGQIERLPKSSFLRRNLAAKVASVFPSSTGPATTSLMTGTWPGEHGVLGWFIYLPEREMRITTLPFVRSSDRVPLAQLGVELDDVFRRPTLREYFRRRHCGVGYAPIASSRVTRWWNGGAPSRPYENLDQMVDVVADAVSETGTPGFTFVHVTEIDRSSHAHGSSSPETLMAVRKVDEAIGRIAGRTGPGVRLIVTADHGHLDAPQSRRYRIYAEDEIGSLLAAPPTSEDRVAMCRLRPGVTLEEFRKRLRDKTGDSFLVLSVADMDETGLLGPARLSDEARACAGDVVVISAGAATIEYCRPGEETTSGLESTHSGLSPDEIWAPLVLN